MYNKDLTKDLRLRLSEKDMDFLSSLASDRSLSVSEVIRSIIGEYRRSIEQMSLLSEALKVVKSKRVPNADNGENVKIGEDVHGDTKTDIIDKL